MDSATDAGVDMRVAKSISAFSQWQEDHPFQANELSLELLDATETTLDFKAKGMLFQLLLPTMPLQNGLESDEILIAMNLDDSAPSGLMVSINEKLERVSVGPRVVHHGLDVFAKALVRYEEKGKLEKSVQLRSNMTLPHNCTLAIESSNDEANAVEVHKNRFSNTGWDMGADDLKGNFNGFLHALIREARERCEVARQSHVGDSRYVPIEQNCTGLSSDLSSLDDTLQFCKVSAGAEKFQVRIQAEVVGFVNDVNIATSLGLPSSKTIRMALEFENTFYVGRSLRKQPLSLRRVAVDLEMGSSTKLLPDAETSGFNPTRVGSSDDEDFQAECKKFNGRQRITAYGTSVLIPDLINAFFDIRNGTTAFNPRPRPWQNQCLDETLRRFTSLENPLIGLIGFLGFQMRALPSWCAVCWSLLPVSVWRLRTCRNDLCLYDFEELGLGATIHHEIQESPEVVELELSLACAAASSDRDVFEPFPSFFLTQGISKGRSGWFTDTSATKVTSRKTIEMETSFKWKILSGLKANFPPVPEFSMTSTTGGATNTAAIRRDGKDERKNKQLTLLLEILQAIPSIATLREFAGDENSLKRTLLKAAYSKWKKMDPSTRAEQRQMWLSYELMRFILSTNRLSLRSMKAGEEFRLQGITPKFQFVVIHDSPEKEAIFNERRSRKGSFFAFHGSAGGNWYCILRNGLRPMSYTKYMSSGATHGQGIYLTDTFRLSFVYGRNSSQTSWKNGSLKDGMVVIAICEVIEGASIPCRNERIVVVPPGQEDSVSVRYLLVMNPTSYDVSWAPTIKRSILETGSPLENRQSVDLREHYQKLKKNDQMLQQRILLDQRTAALLRMKEEAASCPKSGTDRVDKQLPTLATTEPRLSASLGSEGKSLTSNADTAPDSKRLKKNHTSSSSPGTLTQATWAKMSTIVQGQSEMLKPGMSLFSSDRSRFESTSAKQAITAKVTIAQKESGTSHSTSGPTAAATQAISKELKTILKEVRKSQQGTSSSSSGAFGSQQPFLANVTVTIPEEINIYVWHVTLSPHLFKSYANLYKDLQKLAALKKQPECSVLLEVTFPSIYPFDPPFVRVVSPKFVFHTGHVTIGGSICMELLTSNGWLPTLSFESVLVQIVNAFIEGEGRIDMKAAGKEYSREEARRAFVRVADQHGWKVSKTQQQRNF